MIEIISKLSRSSWRSISVQQGVEKRREDKVRQEKTREEKNNKKRTREERIKMSKKSNND